MVLMMHVRGPEDQEGVGVLDALEYTRVNIAAGRHVDDYQLHATLVQRLLELQRLGWRREAH